MAVPASDSVSRRRAIEGDRDCVEHRADRRRLVIAHVIHRLQVGGLENGLVNLINRLPHDQFKHIIVCLTDYTDFRERVAVDHEIYALHKRPGQDLGMYRRLWKLFRNLRPDIVHTRNLATLEAQAPALLAGVPVRIHGEHGRDVHDLDNTSRKYRWLRKAFRPVVQQYIALSRELEQYLATDIGVPARKLTVICNGVDVARFHPADHRAQPEELLPGPLRKERIIIGTVGRMEPVKDPLNLARAIVVLLRDRPDLRNRIGLMMIGDGSLRPKVQDLLDEAGLSELSWLPGAREDVPDLMQRMDLFVLPSLAEGISNTLLEAMASGLPVVATDVGGNGELVISGETGTLVERASDLALARAIEHYVTDEPMREKHGARARERAVQEFSIDAMVDRYADVYESAAARFSRRRQGARNGALR